MQTNADASHRMSTTRQSLEEVYQSWTPLLLSALGRLRRDGYPLDPLERLDLIHDFYLEVVPGLLDRYDPERGQFSTYLYGAFLRFGRPRIVRELRWKGTLADLDQLPMASIPASWPDPVDLAESVDSDGLFTAIAHQFALLPSSLRAVVTARILDGLSERDTARRLRVTRYAVRQRTSEALGRLAIGIGADHRISSEFRPLALRVWRDGRSLMQAASDLGLSRPKARAAYRRLLATVAAASARTREGDAQRGEVMIIDICTIWQQVVANPSDPEAIKTARANLRALLEHVDDCEACAARATNDDLERLFDTLSAGADTLSEEESRTIDALHEAWDSSERSIETAMTDVLLPALPGSLADLASLGEGVTPLTAFLALSSIDHLVYRVIGSTGGEHVEVTSEGAFINGVLTISPDMFVQEMERHARVPLASAQALFAWAQQVPTYVPGVFLHFVAETTNGAHLQLTLAEPTLQHNLAERWAPARTPAAVEELVPTGAAVALRQIQATAETWTAHLEAAANTAASEDVRNALLQQADSNRKEAAAIANALRSVRVAKIDAVEVLRTAANLEQTKHALYETARDSFGAAKFKASHIKRVIQRGRRESKSRGKEAEKVAKGSEASG